MLINLKGFLIDIYLLFGGISHLFFLFYGQRKVNIIARMEDPQVEKKDFVGFRQTAWRSFRAMSKKIK